MSERNGLSPSPSPVDPTGLGARVAQRRAQLGWKQVELSRRTGIAPTRLSRLEKGRCAPRLEELVRLGSVLDMGLDQIVFGKPAGSSPTQRLAGEVDRLGSPEELEVIRRLLHCLISGYQADRKSHAG